MVVQAIFMWFTNSKNVTIQIKLWHTYNANKIKNNHIKWSDAFLGLFSFFSSYIVAYIKLNLAFKSIKKNTSTPFFCFILNAKIILFFSDIQKAGRGIHERSIVSNTIEVVRIEKENEQAPKKSIKYIKSNPIMWTTIQYHDRFSIMLLCATTSVSHFDWSDSIRDGQNRWSLTKKKKWTKRENWRQNGNYCWCWKMQSNKPVNK